MPCETDSWVTFQQPVTLHSTLQHPPALAALFKQAAFSMQKTFEAPCKFLTPGLTTSLMLRSATVGVLVGACQLNAHDVGASPWGFLTLRLSEALSRPHRADCERMVDIVASIVVLKTLTTPSLAIKS